MKTNISIDSELVKEVVKVYRTRAKNSAIEKALRDQIATKKRKSIIKHFGKVEFFDGYDYKSMRQR